MTISIKETEVRVATLLPRPHSVALSESRGDPTEAGVRSRLVLYHHHHLSLFYAIITKYPRLSILPGTKFTLSVLPFTKSKIKGPAN